VTPRCFYGLGETMATLFSTPAKGARPWPFHLAIASLD
jgi:hypothetical protein